MIKLHIHERICTSCSERVPKCVCQCSQHIFNIHTCTCIVLTTPVEMHAHSPQKMHMRSCMRACATKQKLLCHGSYCKLILSLARASCRLSFAARPPAVSTKSVARRCSIKKSVQFHASSWCSRHCGVGQASFDHPHWCRPHPVCLCAALETWPRSSPITVIYFHLFSRRLSPCILRPLASCMRPTVLWETLHVWVESLLDCKYQ